MTPYRISLLGLSLFLLVHPVCAADDLFVATGSVEITAPVGYSMGGYSARRGVSRGVHDPLLAKVLLLRVGEEQVALITFDLVGFQSRRVPHEAWQRLGIPWVLQISSHTHSGPIPGNRERPEEDPWFREVEGRVLQLLEEVQTRLEPARLAVTRSSVLLGHNRRKVHEDGTVTMFWRNAERLPTAPVDPTVGILRFTDPQGRILAVVTHYACHTVVLGPDNLDYSADYVGFMYRHVERELGGGALCFFVPGAAGDINPYNDKQPVSEDGFGVAREMGEKLGSVVLQALGGMPEAGIVPDLRVSRRLYEFRHRFQPEERIPVEVVHLLLGPDTAMLTIPGEVFVGHQLDLRARSPLPNTWLVGYAYTGEGQSAGYVPTIQAAMEGGYGAGYTTRIEVGAGERMVDGAIIWIYEQLGKIRDVPALAGF
jgi:neutral ceramidase